MDIIEFTNESSATFYDRNNPNLEIWIEYFLKILVLNAEKFMKYFKSF